MVLPEYRFALVVKPVKNLQMAQLGQYIIDWRIKRQLAALDTLHCGETGHDLGARCDPHDGVKLERTLVCTLAKRALPEGTLIFESACERTISVSAVCQGKDWENQRGRASAEGQADVPLFEAISTACGMSRAAQACSKRSSNDGIEMRCHTAGREGNVRRLIDHLGPTLTGGVFNGQRGRRFPAEPR